MQKRPEQTRTAKHIKKKNLKPGSNKHRILQRDRENKEKRLKGKGRSRARRREETLVRADEGRPHRLSGALTVPLLAGYVTFDWAPSLQTLCIYLYYTTV